MARHLFTSESVTEGHPDKICDQISDAILDEILTHDPDARVACETCASTGLVHIMGEITTNCYVDFQKVVREVVADIGYTRAKFGFDAASAGLVGLTISLAAQDSAKNLFSGLVILLDRPFSIGDWITVGDVSGEVVDINFRSTKVRALDNSVYILTNSTVSSATINNGTLRNKRLYRFTLGVTYDTTRPQLEQLMTDLTAMLKASPYTYEDSVLVKLSGFGASSIDLLVSAYLRTADMTRFLQMQNDLNLDLMDVMQKNGVDFAFPSTTVYLEKNN